MKLFDDEQVLIRSRGDVLVLTTHRVRYETKTHVTSMMLEEVASVAGQRESYPVLGFLGALLLILSAVMRSIDARGLSPEAALVLVFLGLVLVILYFTTKRGQLVIASAGGHKITLGLEHMDGKAPADFATEFERAKNDRFQRRSRGMTAK